MAQGCAYFGFSFAYIFKGGPPRKVLLLIQSSMEEGVSAPAFRIWSRPTVKMWYPNLTKVSSFGFLKNLQTHISRLTQRSLSSEICIFCVDCLGLSTAGKKEWAGACVLEIASVLCPEVSTPLGQEEVH